MNVESLHEYCLSKPGAEETLPFGPDTIVYKVGGKIFLLTGLDSENLSFNVKCDPEKVIKLREEFRCVLPGYHMNKKHWNSIRLRFRAGRFSNTAKSPSRVRSLAATLN